MYDEYMIINNVVMECFVDFKVIIKDLELECVELLL